jgi:hypothetical protein
MTRTCAQVEKFNPASLALAAQPAALIDFTLYFPRAVLKAIVYVCDVDEFGIGK